MRSLSKHVYKGHQVSVQDDKCVIDSNGVMEIRMQAALERQMALEAQAAEPEEYAQEEEGVFFEGLSADQLSALTSEDGATVIRAAEQASQEEEIAAKQAEAEQVLEQARMEAEQILEQARAEAEQIRAKAGQDGYSEGQAKAMQEEQAMRAQLEEEGRNLQASFDQMVSELEPLFADAFATVYEKVFRMELSGYRDLVINLADMTLREIPVSENYLVHLSPASFRSLTNEKRKELESAVMGRGKLEIIEDIAMEDQQCLIETDGGLFDCSMDTELEALSRRLRLLSYETSQSE